MSQTRWGDALKGFILLEWVVYSMILSLLALFAMDWVCLHQRHRAHLSKKSSTLVALCAAHDLMVRDLRVMASVNDLKKFGPEEYIWHMGAQDVGWRVQGGMLCRTQGAFNTAQEVWHGASTALVAQGVDEMSMNIEKIGEHALCSCSLKGGETFSDRVVALSLRDVPYDA
jgi:type II secretory pathway component PulJ